MRFTLFRGTTQKALLHRENVIHPHGLHRKNMPYLLMWALYYAWVVAFTTWWTASPVSDSAFDTQIRSVMHAVTLLSSAVFIIILPSDWYLKAVRIGAVLIVLCIAVFYLSPPGTLRVCAAVCGAIAIGGVNICILIPFVFILNNTEKLYAVLSSNLLIQLISLINEQRFSDITEPVMSFTLLLLSLGTVLFFRKEPVKAKDNGTHLSKPEMSSRIYLSLLFNCAVAFL